MTSAAGIDTAMARSAADQPGAVAPIPLSIVIRTLNEADRIEATIRSALPLVGEILVVDAGSTDDTVAIAERLGARVLHNPWPGFGPQRYFGESHCSHDMVFCLDADEILPPEFVAEIRALFSRPQVPRLMIIRKAMVLPHWTKPPPLPFCSEQIYLYDRRVARTGPNPNWDKLEITTDEPPHKVRSAVWHYSLRDWNHAVSKLNYVAQLAAETQAIPPRPVLLFRLLFEFPANFVKFYLFRRYFLAGADGLTLAVVSAFGRFLRIAKLLEQRDHGPTGPRRSGSGAT
jgi:glycosyltransferase involved in cell wall biosynthesis